MEWGLLNKIWATANVRYSVIVVFSLEDIGCCYKCRFVKHEPISLCHHITKVFLTAIPVCSQVLPSWKNWQGKNSDMTLMASSGKCSLFHPPSLFWTNNQICHPFRYALVWCYFSESFPSYDVPSQLWQNLQPSSSDLQKEQTWYILMRRSGLTSEATVRQSHLCKKKKKTQRNRLFASIHQYSGIETDVPWRWSELNAMMQRNVANTRMSTPALPRAVKRYIFDYIR